MITKLKKLNEGFTIVETLIVLAIAALIITIVLIAVPDLQRSSRNTGIYHDAQNVASAVQTYEGNNEGALPYTTGSGQITATTGSVVVGVSGAGATAAAHVQKADTVYYNVGALTTLTFTGTASATSMAIGEIVIDSNATCPATLGHKISTTGGNKRSVAVLYPIEGTSTATSSVGCIQE
jgi:prepilin-type N-terminal cleavage/methylation domain-containing protein